MSAVTERAPAKVNLVLRVGAPGSDGLHPLCSLFARLDLADEVTVQEAGVDQVLCPGVAGPNLAARAVAAYRDAAGGRAAVPPLKVIIHKRIPVAAGMAGGSADAAATLRGAAAVSGHPVGAERLVEIARALGSDVPSQLDPAHAVVAGKGELVAPVNLATMTLVLIPDPAGISTAAVYSELDAQRATGRAVSRTDLDPAPLHDLARLPAGELAAALENDLQQAALSLRPALVRPLADLERAGALGTLITGSGPTAFGVFEHRAAADRAAAGLPGAIVAEVA